MRSLVAALFALAAACSSSSGGDGGPCAQRKGTYVIDFKARTGDCGDQAESVATIQSQPTSIDPPCSGSIGYSADNCRVTNDYSCPSSAGPGFKQTIHAEFDWSRDGSSATGIFQLDVVDGRGQYVCHGTYDAAAQRR